MKHQMLISRLLTAVYSAYTVVTVTTVGCNATSCKVLANNYIFAFTVTNSKQFIIRYAFLGLKMIYSFLTSKKGKSFFTSENHFT